MKILAIETSCDETSAAVVENGTEILSNIISSQIDVHQKYGGVVPEVASRHHLEAILPVIDESLTASGCDFTDIDGIGVINRPGLIGALIVGVAAAKSLSLSLAKPLIGVHHLEAHIYANWLSGKIPHFPLVCLIVSGGHSDIVYMKGHGDYEILARTRDDAAGEAFDKCARAMGLGYPGGPIIDRLAKEGTPDAITFPRARAGDTLDFSFSGLKTAVVRFFETEKENYSVADIAASFQEAVVDVLVENTIKAAKAKGVSQVLAAGGVAANSRLQKALAARCEEESLEVSAPPPRLCTDNAAMAASAAYFYAETNRFSDLAMDSMASEPLAGRSS